jgi:hypothetical protein
MENGLFLVLVALLTMHFFQEVKVYRVGKRRIIALVVGRTKAGDLAGLKATWLRPKE